MFYSQFILAKKGPLGTIWIAAHLERRLRKNQVADTDIGVSVDSIIFPEVPIALRLSSHLMLGVVRIYSRKVNYLFHDCSEALLKIKQAFRSTAVDLPPEESTAPYHSITLPETFHLDDFELPEAALQGDNDHHVSTKEQITLQDNPERTGYSTSQFGLDERFGDGNSSHIGLDLEEELLLNKDQLGSDNGIMIQAQSSVPPPSMDDDDNQSKDECAEGYNNMEGAPANHNKLDPLNSDDVGRSVPSNWSGYNIQTPDLNEMFFPNNDVAGPSASYNERSPFPGDEPASPEFISAQAPATPGLMEETVPSRVHESPVLSPQQKASPSSHDDTAKADNSIASVSNFPLSTANVNDVVDSEMTEIVLAKRVQFNSSETAQGNDTLRQQYASEDLQTQVAPQDGTLSSIHSAEASILEGEKGAVEAATFEHVPLVENTSELFADVSTGPSVTENAPQITEASADMQEHRLQLNNSTETIAEFQQSIDLIPENIPTGHMTNDPIISEFPEPEKMLSAPHVEIDQANNLGQITAEKEVTESDGSNKLSSLSSRKRHLEDTLPALETANTAKLSGRPRGRRNNDVIPDDDDILASILVGKRTPGLRLGSTPPPPKATSLKRPRLAPKMATLKRKVQMDDDMVLHADTIRQQLISTEDIRRIRKKAPCVRSEIWMIEKGSLEDEIFHEPILCCASEELINLHYRTYKTVVHPTIQNMELQGRLDMSEAEAKDSSNAGISDAKDNSTLDHLPHTELPSGGAQSCALHPEAANAPDATAASGLLTQSVKQVNNEFEGVAVETVAQGMIESLIQCENGATIMDNNSNAELINEAHFHAQVDNINCLQDVPADFQKSRNSDTPLFVLDDSVQGADADAPPDSVDAKVSAPDAVLDVSGPAYMASADDMKELLCNGVQGDDTFGNKEVPTSEITGAQSTQDTSGFPQSADDENAVSTMGENSGLQESNLRSFVDPGIIGNEFAPKECSDFGSAIHGVDTDFLNYDDDVDYDEEANVDVPNPEELHSLDNSGWSSRTRGVARYLKTLFDEESGLGRKSVAIDNLLRGKTCKEASRMFFETLVLKTKDYIQVEQPNPFDFITVKPGIKLMKSDF